MESRFLKKWQKKIRRWNGKGNVMIREYSYHRIEKNWEILKGKKVIIWCKSMSALQAYKALHDLNIEVIGFTDSFVAETGTTFAGLPVYTFEEIKAMKGISIYIATEQNVFKREILEKVQKLENADVYANGFVFGAGEYNVEQMKKSLAKADDKIKAVRQKLQDERSREVFDKLLEYRVSNDTSLLDSVFEKTHLQYFPTDGIIQAEPDEVFIDAGAYDGARPFYV